jgi:hypothetical protein
MARRKPDQAPMIESRNIGRTVRNFQCRARIINGLFCLVNVLAAAVSRRMRNRQKKRLRSIAGTEAQAVSAGSLKPSYLSITISEKR